MSASSGSSAEMRSLRLAANPRRILRGFCKFMRGEDARGNYVDGRDSEAVRWCALGAIDAETGVMNDDWHIPVRILAAQVPHQYRQGSAAVNVAAFNNSTDQVQTAALFERAIEAAQWYRWCKERK